MLIAIIENTWMLHSSRLPPKAHLFMRLSVNISIWSGLSHIWPRPREPDPGEDLLWFLLISLLVRGKQAPASWEWLHTEQASPQGGAGEGGTEAREVGSCSAPAGGLCCHQLPAWPLCLTSSDAQGPSSRPSAAHTPLGPGARPWAPEGAALPCLPPPIERHQPSVIWRRERPPFLSPRLMFAVSPGGLGSNYCD